MYQAGFHREKKPPFLSPETQERHPSMADAIWESYRPELERLYIHENQKLGEVREYLRIKYGFDERSVPYYPAAPTNIENLISK